MLNVGGAMVGVGGGAVGAEGDDSFAASDEKYEVLVLRGGVAGVTKVVGMISVVGTMSVVNSGATGDDVMSSACIDWEGASSRVQSFIVDMIVLSRTCVEIAWDVLRNLELRRSKRMRLMEVDVSRQTNGSARL